MSGVELIAAERERQVSAEGWTPEHDDTHTHGEMLRAGMSYAEAARRQVLGGSENHVKRLPDVWPLDWDDTKFWKPSPDPIRNLVKAGALIAAEIDRLQRANPQGGA